MSYILDSGNRSVLVFIKSRQLDQTAFLQTGYNTSFRIQLDNPITCNTGETILCSLYSASIPMTMYNLDSFENSFTIGGTPYNVTPGSYNVRNLLETFKTTVESITGAGTLLTTYNSITNKVTLTYSGVPTLILTSIAKTLGFNTNTTITGTMTSPNIFLLYDDLSMYLRTNLNLGNARDHRGAMFDALERIPFKSSGSVIYYEAPPHAHRNIILDRVVSDFNISLTFDNSNEFVQLNGADWELVLLFETIKNLERGTPVDLRKDLEALRELLIAPNTQTTTSDQGAENET